MSPNTEDAPNKTIAKIPPALAVFIEEFECAPGYAARRGDKPREVLGMIDLSECGMCFDFDCQKEV